MPAHLCICEVSLDPGLSTIECSFSPQILSDNAFYSQPTVDIKTVLSQLMDRLSNYAASSTDVSYLTLSL